VANKVSYTEFSAGQSYQRGILRWSWNEVYITFWLDRAIR